MSTQLNDALKKFNSANTEEELIEAIQNQPYLAGIPSHETPIFIDYIKELIFIKHQKMLIKEQNEFNGKLLNDNHQLIEQNIKLVKATWILAIATIILVIVTLIPIMMNLK